MTSCRLAAASAVLVVAVAVFSAAQPGLVLAQAGGFGDVADDVYYSVPVEALAADGVFEGTECGAGLFCPHGPIDRKTMSVWTVRIVSGQDPPPVSQTRFADVDPESFYGPFVERMADLQITLGCGDGTRFCPDDTVTRAEMAVFLSRAFDLDEGPDPGFSDVAPDAWYASEVAKLAASGITSGCGDGTVFCPDQFTLRAQMAVFLHRARNLTGTPGTTEPAPAGAATYRAVDGTCAILTDDTITCWGLNLDGEANAPAGTYKTLAAGSHNCAIAIDDTITCWGRNWYGEANPPAGTYNTVAVGGWFHSCAIATDGTLACWGRNDDGKADPPAGTYTTLSTSSEHNCAIATDGTITCWGENWLGRTDAPAGTYKTLSTSRYHNCAMATDDTIACWGAACGTLAGGGWGCRKTNWAPLGTYKTLATGYAHSCAIATDGSLTCWGNNEHGQTDAPAGTYTTVATGGRHSCAIAADGTIACWGNNEHGQTDAPAGTHTTVATGGRHSCAIATDGTIACWGNNDNGPADPPQTLLEVAATQPLAPLDLSSGAAISTVSGDVLDFDMIDASTGATVNLRSVVNGRTPLLFWLYSPY